MSRPIDSTHHAEPTTARHIEEAARQKAVEKTEKRELVGEAEYETKHLDNLRENPNAVLENPLQVSKLVCRELFATLRCPWFETPYCPASLPTPLCERSLTHQMRCTGHLA